MDYDPRDAYDADRGENHARFLQARSDVLDALARIDSAGRLLILEYLGVPEARRGFFIDSVLAEFNSSQLARVVRDILRDAGHSVVGRDLLEGMRSFAEFRNRLAHNEVVEEALHLGEFRLVGVNATRAVSVVEMEQRAQDGQELVAKLLGTLELVAWRP